MTLITLKGYVTEEGELKVELPDDHPVGEVNVTIESLEMLTDDEIAEMMRPQPKTGAEIAQSDAIGAWAHRGIKDGVDWVQEQRHKRRNKLGW